jgi:hypothetical protein
METRDERVDTIFIVVTVLKSRNDYRLRKFKPKTLAPNEFCYAFRITIDKKAWFNRVAEIDLGKPRPPEFPKARDIRLIIAKATAQQALDRLAGRDEEILQELK